MRNKMAAKKASLDKDSGLVDNWQCGKSIKECLKYSLDYKILFDVSFKVGVDQKTIQAHKLILSLRSSVFLAMTFGLMATQDNIVIPDIEPAIFEVFLQFLYTDQITITANNVIGLRYAARKYDILTLERQCIHYLDTSLNSGNACFVMEQAHLYDDQELKAKSYKLICQNGDAALKTEAVIGLCKECLDEIVESEKLKVSEETVFEAVLAWSGAACRNLGREITPENRREVLGETALRVRYPLLPQDYFVNTVLPTKLLIVDEGFNIMKHLLCPDKDVSPFIARKRNASTKLVTTRITRLELDTMYQMTCTGDTDEGIMFSVNKNAALIGFQLYGARDDTTETYDVTAFLTNASMDEIMDGSSITTTAVAETLTYDILFPQAVDLNKDEKYCLIVNINGPDTYYGYDGQSVVKEDNITCSFFDYMSSKHSNKERGITGVVDGQIPGLLFHVDTD